MTTCHTYQCSRPASVIVHHTQVKHTIYLTCQDHAPKETDKVKIEYLGITAGGQSGKK